MYNKTNWQKAGNKKQSAMMKIGTSKTNNATVIQTKGNKKFYPIYHHKFNTVYKNTILWNPNQGIETNNGTRLSPATGFAHECAHEVNSLEDPNYIDNSKDDSSNPYDSIDEQNVIQGDEQTQAEANGETPTGVPTRSNHDGSPFEVDDPTETK